MRVWVVVIFNKYNKVLDKQLVLTNERDAEKVFDKVKRDFRKDNEANELILQELHYDKQRIIKQNEPYENMIKETTRSKVLAMISK